LDVGLVTDHPVYGSRRLQVALLREAVSAGRRRVRRLMKKLGLWAVRPKRSTSKRHPGHKVYPYLPAWHWRVMRAESQVRT
jgi:putative transposase